jgi:hypothetical protein
MITEELFTNSNQWKQDIFLVLSSICYGLIVVMNNENQ